jgi:protein SCO1/2
VKKQHFILIVILLLPSLIYVFLTTGKHHFISLPFYGPREAVTKTVDGKQITDTIYHSVPSFKFVNQDGDTVTEKNYEGRIYIADFFFTTCQSICPKMSANLAVVQDKFIKSDSVLILSHTVNPGHDSAQILKAYAELVHANTKKWNFVTGSKKDIYEIAYKGYMLNAVEDTTQTDIQKQFLHDEHFILVDKEKHIRGIYDGTSLPDVNKLIDDIKLLQADYIIKKAKQDAKKNRVPGS